MHISASVFVVLLATAAVLVAAAPAATPVDNAQPSDVTVLKYENDNGGADGGYKFAYETSDGVTRQEQGELRSVDGSETPVLAVRGTISWVAPDGQQYTLNYVADENGYQPQGDHLPKA